MSKKVENSGSVRMMPRFFLTLCCLYYFQGVLYASGGIFSQLLLAVILVWSFYYFLVANFIFKLPKLMKMLSVLVVLWIIYGLITLIKGRVISWASPYYYLKNIATSLLPIYTFYVYTKRGLLTERTLTRWLYVFVIIGIVLFYRNETELVERIQQDEVTNNMGYTVLSIFPLLPLLRRKPVIQYVVLALLLFFVLQGFKRGAIISGVLCSVFFLFETIRINRQYKRAVSGKQVVRILLTVGVVVAAVYAVQQTMGNSDYFNQRIQLTMEGNDSGRTKLYSTFYNFFINQNNPLTFLFGNGGDATLKIGGNYAHNDWLEIAINNGLWMVVLYALYWIMMIQHIFRTRKNNPTAYMMIGLFFIFCFVRSFVSMSYNDISFFASCAFGYALANGDSVTEEERI